MKAMKATDRDKTSLRLWKASVRRDIELDKKPKTSSPITMAALREIALIKRNLVILLLYRRNAVYDLEKFVEPESEEKVLDILVQTDNV